MLTVADFGLVEDLFKVCSVNCLQVFCIQRFNWSVRRILIIIKSLVEYVFF